jgi:hypothetical protein
MYVITEPSSGLFGNDDAQYEQDRMHLIETK